MATVRIYKVAELLGTTSQEVSALLKRDHGIEVKSASSTIEEVVARQFVDRLARQRNIVLPTGDIFAETPPAKSARSRRMAKKAPEPVKPAAPVLPPPRLVKTLKPIAAPVSPAPEPESEVAEAAPEPRRSPRPRSGRRRRATGRSRAAAAAGTAVATVPAPAPVVEVAPEAEVLVEPPVTNELREPSQLRRGRAPVAASAAPPHRSRRHGRRAEEP